MYRHALILISVIFGFISCKSSYKMTGKIYELSDYEQKIKISFINDSICVTEQYFKCDKIEDSLKFTEIKANYYLTKSQLHYLKNSKPRKKTVHFLRLKSLNHNGVKPKYTYIPRYTELCEKSFEINSPEMKARKKITSGIILNLVNDSLLVKRDTIIFGYKQVPLKN